MSLDAIRIVLVEPAHPGNIGAVARAMKTMGLNRLVLVKPEDFPSEDANRRAMGSTDVLRAARVVDDLNEAVADCRIVVGSSARTRTFRHPIFDARECGLALVRETASGEQGALVLGPERTGLSNQDLDRCTHQVRIPTSEQLSSLNLASAVQLLSYEIQMASRIRAQEERGPAEPVPEHPGRHREVEAFFSHLEAALDSRGFLDGQMREVTLVKFRRIFGRARPTAGDLKLLHSLLKLVHKEGE